MLLTKASVWFVHIVPFWSNLLPLPSPLPLLFCCHTGLPTVLWGSDDRHLLFPCLEHYFPRNVYVSLPLLQVVVTFSGNSSLVTPYLLSLSSSGRLLFLWNTCHPLICSVIYLFPAGSLITTIMEADEGKGLGFPASFLQLLNQQTNGWILCALFEKNYSVKKKSPQECLFE